MDRVATDMGLLAIPELPEERAASPLSEIDLDSDDSEVYFYPSECKPATQIAKIFDEAGVPHLLWGEWAAATIGGFTANPDIDFVIPDDFIDKARSTLVSAGYKLCPCDKHSRPPFGRDSPPGDVHFSSLPHRYYKGPLRLHCKSKILWWVPDFPLEHPAEDDHFFTLTNDPRAPPRPAAREWDSGVFGPSGPWTDLYPVKILKPVPFTEALIFLECRDHKVEHDFAKEWRYLMQFMLENKPEPHLYIKKTLRPLLRRYWEHVNTDDGSKVEVVRDLFDSVRQLLIENILEELLLSSEIPQPPEGGWLGDKGKSKVK